MASAARPPLTLSWRAQRGHPSSRRAVMDCRATLAVTEMCHGKPSAAITGSVMASQARPSKTPSWRAQRGHPSSMCAVMDCHATLAVTEMCNGKPSAAIKDPVMASAARPSIFEVRGDGLPHFARSDGIFGLLFTVCVQFRVAFRKLALARSQTWPRPLAYPRA